MNTQTSPIASTIVDAFGLAVAHASKSNVPTKQLKINAVVSAMLAIRIPKVVIGMVLRVSRIAAVKIKLSQLPPPNNNVEGAKSMVMVARQSPQLLAVVLTQQNALPFSLHKPYQQALHLITATLRIMFTMTEYVL